MAAPEEKDDPYYATRLAVVRQINRDRGAAGLHPVELDVFASMVADHHCQEMAARHYLSHWNLRGLLPYQRYHLAGGRDHVQENLSRMTVTSNSPAPIPTGPTEILPYLLQTEERFLQETPPLDGHRQNILDPPHTHVGIGFAVVGGEFTMAEEFLNRYVWMEELPEALPPGPLAVAGQMLRKDLGPYYCVLLNDGLPRARTLAELNNTFFYSDTDGDRCAVVQPWQMHFDPSSGRFNFSIPTHNCGTGYYHLLLWVRDQIGSIPYQLHPGVRYHIDTRQAVPAAGWVFRQ